MVDSKNKTPHLDQKYIDAMRNNDELEIQKAYELCISQLKNFVLKNSGNISAAEDLHQDTFLKLYDKANNEPDFKLYVPFCGFYYFIYKRLWLNKLKKRGRQDVIISDLDLYKNETHAEQLVGELNGEEVLLDKLCEAFNLLGDRCKTLLKLNYKKNLSSKEIAAKLNMSVSNVNKSMSDCRRRLKKLIDQII